MVVQVIQLYLYSRIEFTDCKNNIFMNLSLMDILHVGSSERMPAIIIITTLQIISDITMVANQV